MMGRSKMSAISLSALGVFVVLCAVGKSLFEWKWWDLLLVLSSLAFIVGLIVALVRTKPAISDLPDPDIRHAERPGFWVRTLLLFLGLILAFILGLVIGTGTSMILVCGLLGLGVTLAWRRTLTWKIAGLGLVAGLIPALGTVFLARGDLAWAAVYLVAIPPAFSGGVLLLQRTQLGHVRIVEGELARGLRGFLAGCVLALPASLLNLLGGLQSQDTWLLHWWQPLYAIVPAIAEETLFRLFLLSFCYAVLRPVTNDRPRRAVVVAIAVSVLAWGFGHTGINLIGIIFGSVVYGLPVALLMIKKDFEHAVGYHFMVDLVRYIAAFLV